MSKKSTPFLLRLNSDLFEKLKARAIVNGVSMNEFCKSSLQKEVSPSGPSTAFDELKNIIHQALGIELIGAVLFGSTARGTATSNSDRDLLLVIDSGACVSRELYELWDQLTKKNKRSALSDYSPHFCALPSNPLRTEGIWLETALDGIVLWEAGFRVSRFLGEIRRAIVEQKFVRKSAHGHPYWILASDVQQDSI